MTVVLSEGAQGLQCCLFSVVAQCWGVFCLSWPFRWIFLPFSTIKQMQVYFTDVFFFYAVMSHFSRNLKLCLPTGVRWLMKTASPAPCGRDSRTGEPVVKQKVQIPPQGPSRNLASACGCVCRDSDFFERGWKCGSLFGSSLFSRPIYKLKLKTQCGPDRPYLLPRGWKQLRACPLWCYTERLYS